MNSKRMIRKSAVIALCCAIVLSACSCGKKEPLPAEPAEQVQSTPAAAVFNEPAASLTKNETVYINLENSGKITELSVSDWLHTDKSSVFADDISTLTDIRNIKSSIVPEQNGEALRWHMPTTDIYYSGKTEKEPPVKLNISYYLNGEKLDADKIAGKSGKIKIVIGMENTLSKSVTVNGKKEKISLPMLVVGGMILPQPEFSAVTVNSGTSIGDGTKEIAAFVAFPGLSESLGLKFDPNNEEASSLLSSEVSITADTDCFELGNIYFAAIPIASLDLGFDFSKSFEDIKAFLPMLDKLQEAFSGADPEKLISLLSQSGDKIGSLTSLLNDSVKLMKNNGALIDLLSKYSTPENSKKINKLISVMTDPKVQKAFDSLDRETIDTLLNADPEAISSLLSSLEKAAGLYQKNKQLFDLLSVFIENGGAEELGEVFESLKTPEAQSAMKLFSDKNFTTLISAFSGLGDSLDLITSLASDMQTKEMKNALNELPLTLETINSISKAIDENSELIDSLSELFNEDAIKALSSIPDMINGEDITKLLGKYSSIISAPGDIASRVQAWLNYGKSYRIFTSAPEDAKTSVIFIYRTSALTAPDTAPVQEDTGSQTGRLEEIIQKIKAVFQ